MRSRIGDGAEIGGEGKQRPRNRLRRAVTRKESVVVYPARRDKRFPKKRQHHMAAAEDQRAGAVKRIEQCGVGAEITKKWKARQQDEKDDQRRHSRPARDRHYEMARFARLPAAA